MFGFGKKKSYEDKFRDCLANKDVLGADVVARKAFSDKKSDEPILGWLAGSIYDLKLEQSLDLIQVFVERFPSSLHPMRAFIADLYARSENFDKATLEARMYLRTVKDSGFLEVLESKNIVRSGVSMAFLLAVSAYTELGARTFSKSVLKMALSYGISPEWSNIISSEIDRLNEELKDPDNHERDEMWNSFYTNGTGADTLHEHCNSLDYPVMAEFVDLIEGNFRFNSSYRVGPESIFHVIMTSDGSSVLA